MKFKELSDDLISDVGNALLELEKTDDVVSGGNVSKYIKSTYEREYHPCGIASCVKLFSDSRGYKIMSFVKDLSCGYEYGMIRVDLRSRYS